MRGKLWFVGGLAVGFVLGARAGRERYEQLLRQGRRLLDHPTVQEAAGLAQAQASRIYTEGRNRFSHTRLGERLGVGSGDNGRSAAAGGGGASDTSASAPPTSGTTSGSRSDAPGSGGTGTTT